MTKIVPTHWIESRKLFNLLFLVGLVKILTALPLTGQEMSHEEELTVIGQEGRLNRAWLVGYMDETTIKTPNPKCRLYWCSIEFRDWSHSQLCWYLWPLLWTIVFLTFSLVHLPPSPLPTVGTSTGLCICTACNSVYKIALPPQFKTLERRGVSDR